MITLAPIRKACADATGYHEELIFSKARTAPLPWIRACAAQIARERGFKWRDIAEGLGFGKHSSAVAAAQRCREYANRHGYELERGILSEIRIILNE